MTNYTEASDREGPLVLPGISQIADDPDRPQVTVVSG